MTDGLKDAHREAIIAVIAANDRVERAVLFGSRATGTNTVTSDVDIALFGERLTLTDQARLSAAVEEIPMAQSVDLILYDSLRDRTLRKHIGCQGVEWYARPTRVASDPENWPMLHFKELLEGSVRNGIYKRKEYRGHGIMIVNMGELFAHPRLRAVPMKRVDLSKSEMERFSVVEGDLLFARRSLVAEGAGKCCVVLRVDEPTTFESSIIRARPDPTRSDSLYLYYFFSSPLGLHLLDTIRRQVAVAGITGKDLAELTIPAPSAPAQRAIAQVLGTLDDKIDLNRRTNETLEAMARALFKSWFVDFDPVRAKMEGRDTCLSQDIADLFPDRLVDSEMGEMPEGWRRRTLADLARLNPESWSSRNAPDCIRYVDLANTKWGSINDIQEFTWEDAPSRGRRVLRRGDTIVGTVRPRNGSFALIDRDSLTGSTAFAVLRPATPTERELVWCAATSQDAIERLAHLADGGAYPAVRPRAVLDTAVALPDARVRLAFSSLAAPLVNRMGATHRESRTLASLRDTLLPKLISGEIRVPEAERALESVT